MSMLDSFFSKGFKATKCKTMLKLTIPRIKLLRNRKEFQIKQMRKDIAKLLETGQEATARIRVEHIIREENMMAAQEIIELFCELIAVRLPIIESQKECPLDLKEAISSICFAAPRCADLPELLQVQLAFVSKYGREFVAAATELMPDCGVNRQLIELLSVRAPSPEKKFKLLKEIAEEHELDWDPASSETELFKSHEDLLNGPTQFISGAKVPLPKGRDDENLKSAAIHDADEHTYSEEDFDELDFPEVPKVSLRPPVGVEVAPPQPSVSYEEPSLVPGSSVESETNTLNHSAVDPEFLQADKHESPDSLYTLGGTKQFVPFMSAPSLSSVSFPVRESSQSSNLARTRSDANVDLNDVLAAAKAAAESAERAAAAARTAASLAEIRISELTKNKSGQSPGEETENPFHASSLHNTMENPQHDDKALGHSTVSDPWSPPNYQTAFRSEDANDGGTDLKISPPAVNSYQQELPNLQPQRIPSMDDEYSSYPNLFSRHGGDVPYTHGFDNSQLKPGS